MTDSEFFNRERTELLTAFDKLSEGKEEVVLGDGEDAPKDAETPADEKGDEHEEVAEEKPESSAEEEESEASAEKDEFVPEGDSIEEQLRKAKGAMHEERDKRKNISKKVKELEDQVQTLLRDNKALMEKIESKPDEDVLDDSDDYADPYVKRLEKKIDNLEKIAQAYANERQTETQKSERQKLENTIKTTNEKLNKDGYPGFQFALSEVSMKVQELMSDDPYGEWDTPEGWEKIYKEHIYPEMKKMFLSKDTEEERRRKIENKKKAELAGSPGKSGKETEKSDEEWTYDDYIKERSKRQL